MKRKIILLVLAVSAVTTAYGQMVVTDPTSMAQSILNTSKTVEEAVATRTAVMKNILETEKIFEQTKKYYDYLKKVNNVIKESYEVKSTIESAAEITKMYSECFAKIASDPLYSAEEIAAISYGYARILERSAYALGDLKTLLAGSSLSMTDKERLDAVDRCHDKMEHMRSLLLYYTRKVEAVSSIRHDRGANLDGVIRIYGVMTDIEQ